MEVASGFFVGKAKLKSEALVDRKEVLRVIETFHYIYVVARVMTRSNLLLDRYTLLRKVISIT